jgi:hypothetical protein
LADDRTWGLTGVPGGNDNIEGGHISRFRGRLDFASFQNYQQLEWVEVREQDDSRARQVFFKLV